MSLSCQQLHDLIGKPACEEIDLVFSGVGSLNTAKGDEISFLGNSRYASQLATTSAGVVLVPPCGDYSAVSGCRLIVVENPSAAFSRLVDHFQPGNEVFQAGISASAIISDDVVVDPAEVSVGAGAIIESGVRIGRGTTIGPGCVIGKGVQIGEDCLFHANASIRERCVIGHRVILQPGVVIGSDGYGFELVEGRHRKVPQVGIVEIANDVEVGANSTIDRARFGKTYIGEGTKIDNLVQIGHNCTIGAHSALAGCVGLAGSSHIGARCRLGGGVGVAGHLRICDDVTLTGFTLVTSDIREPGFYSSGIPASPTAEWRHSVARLKRLDHAERRQRKQQESS